MPAMSEDILQQIPLSEYSELLELYLPHKNWAPIAVSVIFNAIKWNQKEPNIITLYSPNQTWKENGTFFAYMNVSSNNLFCFTLEENCKTLFDSFLSTKRFSKIGLLKIWALDPKHHDCVIEAFKELKNCSLISDDLGWTCTLDKSIALEYDCSDFDDFQIVNLEEKHAEVINSYWPHKVDDSTRFIKILIEMNGGKGVILRSTGKLVSWGLLTILGQLGALHTIDEFKRKGLGSLITKVISKEIASAGLVPCITVVYDNHPAKLMYEKLGFKAIHTCNYLLVDFN